MISIFYNWNLKQLQTEKKFDEKQWYDVINGCKELENVIHEQRRLIDAGLEHFRNRRVRSRRHRENVN